MSLVATRSISVGAFLGMTISVEDSSTLKSDLRSPRLLYRGKIYQKVIWWYLLCWPWLIHRGKGLCFSWGYGHPACHGVQYQLSRVDGGVESTHRKACSRQWQWLQRPYTWEIRFFLCFTYSLLICKISSWAHE